MSQLIDRSADRGVGIQNFTLDEFCFSDTAVRLRINNDLPEDLVPSAWVTLTMLERVRSHLSQRAGKDVPITVLSGYRCERLNAAVNGASSSDHVRACAADILAPAFGRPSDVALELSAHVDALGIGQLINEFPGAGGWVHVSTKKPSKLINRIITITGQGITAGVKP